MLLLSTIIAPVTVCGQESNPLLREWNTPHQTPPFTEIKNSDYIPALRTAIKQAQRNIDAIADQKDAPTFENTIVAMERASELLDRISGVLFNLNECNTDAELQQVVLDITPELTRFSNGVSMNEKLFARVKVLYEKRNSLGLNTEQMTLLENSYKSFVRNGVNLDKKNKKIFAKNSEELAQLEQQFNQNVLADNNEYILHISQVGDLWKAEGGAWSGSSQSNMLSGLPENVVAAAREEAQRRNLEGWVFTLAYPSYGPFLTYADNRQLREQMWKAYNSRGNRGNKNDNNALIRRITNLRHQQAKLLGYNTYCEYVLSDRMAENPEKLNQFMTSLMDASYPVARQDLLEVLNFALHYSDQSNAKEPQLKGLERWDFSYYSEKLKQQKYSFDAEQLRPYFQLEKVRQGIFDLYGQLYGLRFEDKTGVISVYHPDVKVYEVYDGSRFMGVLYLDMFPRESKRSGAWMTEFRGQSNIGGQQIRPLIQVVCNFSKPVGDIPALLSFDEVETFMHEFGHAMHGMLSDVTYPSVSGTNVKRDFVELPSQVMENWCYESKFLNTFARHYQTGDTIPGEFIQKIKAAENYLAGYLCVRQLSLGLVDIAFHSITEPIEGKIEDFERTKMVELLPAVQGCNTSTSFTHIFAGGYASGYYGYKWAEVLDADVFSRFQEKGIFDKTTATAFRNELLSRGGTLHPAILFRNFMGRDPNNEALLLRCGFIQKAQSEKPLKSIKLTDKRKFTR